MSVNPEILILDVVTQHAYNITNVNILLLYSVKFCCTKIPGSKSTWQNT